MTKNLTRAGIHQEKDFDTQTVCLPIAVAAKGQVDVQTYAKSGTSDRRLEDIQAEMGA